MYYIIIILFILLIILFIYNSYIYSLESFSNNLKEEEYDYIDPKRFFDISSYKNKLLNNDKKNIFKIGLSDNVKLDIENCFEKCDRRNCILLKNRIDTLQKCLKCNLQENKCFKKSIIEGNCDDCNGVKYEDKINCLDTLNYGCVNPENINLNEGVFPYYIEVDTKNVNSPYNKKCLFCWNILDNI